jgi:hypothetical protein
MVSFALLFRPRCARRLQGCGHVDNASALPTCPQPQQQTQKPINAGSRNKRSLAARISGKHVKPPTDSAEEAFLITGGDRYDAATAHRSHQAHARPTRHPPDPARPLHACLAAHRPMAPDTAVRQCGDSAAWAAGGIAGGVARGLNRPIPQRRRQRSNLRCTHPRNDWIGNNRIGP